MDLPFDMRPSTLKERKKFYQQFDINNTIKWNNRELVYGLILGRHSNIFQKKFKDDKNRPLIIDKYKNLNEVKKLILEYLPEGVYYDRNYFQDISLCHEHNLRDVWEWDNFRGQELAFDIDPENVVCPIHGSLKHRLTKGKGLSFCEKAFELAKENAISLYEELTKKYDDVRIVFSGRGFHIHVFDNKTKHLNKKQRKDIGDQYQKYGIDKWVTSGEMRLIRLPYSLNGFSSRIVTPLQLNEAKKFNPEKDALPLFLKK
jgi:DNA primase catalytic subunit